MKTKHFINATMVGIVDGEFVLKSGKITGNNARKAGGVAISHGTYTKSGVSQTGGTDIVQLEANGGMDDTLIAVMGR